MKKNGIYITGTPGNFREDNLLFNSDIPSVAINIEKQPEHIKNIKIKMPRKLSVATTGTDISTVLEIEHNLPYIPECLVYFTPYEVSPGYETFLEWNYGYAFIYQAGVTTETLTFKVDNKKFYIIHKLFNGWDMGSPQYSIFDEFKWSIRYMIFSVDSGVEGTYDGTFLTVYT